MSFEHHIKGAGFAERVAIRAFDIMLFNGFIHLLHGHALWVDAVVLQDVVGAVAAVIYRILAQWVHKGIDVPAGLPHLRVHDDSRIDAVHIVAPIHKMLPPQLHNITLKRHAQRAIIPRAAQAAVHVRPLVNKASALTETNNIFHSYITVCFTHARRHPFSVL